MPKRNETLFMKRTQITLTWPDGSRQVFPVWRCDPQSAAGRQSDPHSGTISVHVPPATFELRRDKDRYFLKDLGSSNGVFLNGAKIVNEAPAQ